MYSWEEMINNERRLQVAEAKIARLTASRDRAYDDEQRSIYEELISALQEEIHEYNALKSGYWRTIPVESIDDLGPAIVKARLARGLTQKQLAKKLGSNEQNVQQDEDREYEGVRLAMLGELLDALNYEFVGFIRPKFTDHD